MASKSRDIMSDNNGRISFELSSMNLLHMDSMLHDTSSFRDISTIPEINYYDNLALI